MAGESAGELAIGRLEERHRCLYELAHETRGDDIQAVINLGAAILLHADVEPLVLALPLRVVDPVVRDGFADDHARLADDLQFLREMYRADSDNAEIGVITAALLERLRQHLDRERRTLYRLARHLRTPLEATPRATEG